METATGDNTQPEDVSLTAQPVTEQLPDVVDWIPEFALPAWQLVDQFSLVGALVVAAVALLISAFVRFALFPLAGRLGGSGEGIVRTVLVAQLEKPLTTTVLYFGLTLAVKAAQLPFGTDILIQALLSVIVVSWMRAALRLSSELLDQLGAQPRFAAVEERTMPLFDLSAKLLTILFGSYALLLIWGINPVGWLASAGIVGIAVGFAAKDTLANLFSGFFIVADAPYKIGDYINLDSGERGKVSAIGLRSTRLMTRDDIEITIPNGVIAAAKIVNESGGPAQQMRQRIPVGVAYGSDVDQVCEVLLVVGLSHPDVRKWPEPRVRMRGFGASSLDFELLVWIENPEDGGRIKHDLLMATYKALNEAEIEIPYAKQDVYIKEMPSAR
jgi:small-conductance mechanosensitive channel